MVHKALAAGEQLAAQGISVEVIDPRTIVPLDREAILRSVAKTGRLLVADEDYLSFGVTGEIAALVAERLDEITLKAPVRRLALPDAPVPQSKVLELAAIPQVDRFLAAVLGLMQAQVR
jgi:pyruvate dehydrogenase E1 component beta subunit